MLGHKVGLSSKAIQQMMGVDEPDYGHLLDEMQLFEDTPVKANRYLYPRVEVEVGFILNADLPGAGCTEDDVLAATEALVPSIELIDTRITDWKIELCDTIADNASSAGFVLGEARVSPATSTSRGSTRCCAATARSSRRAAPTRCWATPSPRWRGWPARSTGSVCGCARATWCCPDRAREPSTRTRATSSSPTSRASVLCVYRSNRLELNRLT